MSYLDLCMPINVFIGHGSLTVQYNTSGTKNTHDTLTKGLICHRVVFNPSSELKQVRISGCGGRLLVSGQADRLTCEAGCKSDLLGIDPTPGGALSRPSRRPFMPSAHYFFAD